MKNTNLIYLSPAYQDLLEDLRELEKDRIFCKHDLSHFMDVARVCYILVLEEKLGVSKDLVYTTALLHDLGRVEEYRTGLDHHKASLTIASELLEVTDFSREDKNMILGAIESHRNQAKDDNFNSAFYRADKLSRPCSSCPARAGCKWPDEKKNLRINY